MIRAAAFLAALLCAGLSCAAEPAHDISVRIDPQTRALRGRDRISLDTARATTLVLASRFRIDSLAVDGRRIRAQPVGAHAFQRITLPAGRRVELRWSGALDPLNRSLEHRDTLGYNAPASGAEGTFLPAGSGWYPAVGGELERYRVALDLPSGQRGLVPGRLLEEREANGRYRARFAFDHPAEGISLMAGPYRVKERRVRTAAGSDVRLRTYFHPEIADLADGYLDSVAGYLDLYERWIGAYPFTEFSVVSSPTPTGFGMPALTYLGIEVLRLPFIRATSLGHEVLHNWWGNGVYPDYARGNWSEGLTTFMADYAYREREGASAALEARLAWLRDYAAMPPADDTALARFTSRTHGASQVVGYGKSAMLFFMLRESIGSGAFDAGLRRFWREQRFRVASWDELRAAFERASGKPLAAFFEQWLERPGAPELRIADARAVPAISGWHVSVTLAQGTPAYAIPVPLAIRTAGGGAERRVTASISRPREAVEFDLPVEPLAVALDPELRLFRRLAPQEAPPILRELMLAGNAAVFTLSPDPGVQTAGQELAARLLEGLSRPRSEVARGGPAATLVIGLHQDIDEWLAQSGLPKRPPMLARERGSAQVWTVRTGEPRTIALVSVLDASALAALSRPLPHYGRQSWLVLEGGRVTDRGVWPTQPQVWELRAAAGVSRRGPAAPESAARERSR